MTRSILSRLTLFAWFAALAVMMPHPSPAQQNHSIDVGASYTYVHANVLPGCNCFSMNGGSGQAQFQLTHHLDLLGDVTVTHEDNITRDRYALTQTVFAAGLRYFPFSAPARIRSFGDVLVGGAHASGTLSPANTGFGSSTAFAFQTGGGVQISLSRRWMLIPFQAEYLLTTFDNGADNYQNDLRISAGVLFRIRR